MPDTNVPPAPLFAVPKPPTEASLERVRHKAMNGVPLTLWEVGMMLGVSRETVCRHERWATQRLLEVLQGVAPLGECALSSEFSDDGLECHAAWIMDGVNRIDGLPVEYISDDPYEALWAAVTEELRARMELADKEALACLTK